MPETTTRTPGFARSGGDASRNISLSNPEDDGATDLPRLLRRVADLIEAEGIAPLQILDVVVHEDILEEGPWWSVTVHWSPDEGEDRRDAAEAEDPPGPPTDTERLRASVASARTGWGGRRDLADPDAAV